MQFRAFGYHPEGPLQRERCATLCPLGGFKKMSEMPPVCPSPQTAPTSLPCLLWLAGSCTVVCSCTGTILSHQSSFMEGYYQQWSMRLQHTHKHREPIPVQGWILPSPSTHAHTCWGKCCSCSRQIIAPSLASPCTVPCKHTHRAFQRGRCCGSKARSTDQLSLCKGETEVVFPVGGNSLSPLCLGARQIPAHR